MTDRKDDGTPRDGEGNDPSDLPVPHEGGRAVVAHPRSARALALELEQAERPGNDDEIDLLEYWRILVKRRWMVMGVLAFVVVIGLIGTLLMTPIYRASTTMQIERDSARVVDVEGVVPVEAANDRDFYQTQYELLRSRSLAQRVVSQLDLTSDPRYHAAREPSPWRALVSSVRGGVPEEEETFEQRERAAIGWLADHLNVEPIRNSRLLRLHFDSPDAQLSERIVNAYSEAFIASNLDRRFEATSYARTFLEERLAELKLRLEDSEKELVAYAQAEQIINVDDRQSLASTNLGSLNAALSQAQDQRIRAEARWQQAQSAQGLGLAQYLDSPSIQKLRETRAELAARYQENLSVYQPGFPLMQQLQAQMDEVDRLIEAELGNIRASVRSEYDGALAQEQLLATRVDELKDDVLDLRSRSIQYNILQREVDTNRELYEGLLQRYKEIGVAGGVGTNNISIVDRAEVPMGRFKPSLSLNLALAFVIGGMLGVLIAFVLEFLDDSIKSPEEVEKQLGLAVLGVIPKLGKGVTPTEALLDMRSAFSEAYRSVRTALQFSTETGVPRSLLVTSPRPAEGKSTTALTLARNFAQLGKRVLLVDGDLRKPSLHKQLQLDNSVGLTNYLSGAVRPPQAFQESGTPGLQVMCSGPLPPNPAELLSGPRMLSLVTVGSEKFDLVIIDGPPVMGLADAPILSNIAGGTLLVIEAGSTRNAVAKMALKRLHVARARVLGVLLSKFDARKAGHAYGYGYGDASYYAYGAEEPRVARLGRR